MYLLPREPANELVTRVDLLAFGDGMRTELRGEMAELRGELRGEMAEMRGDLTALSGRFDEKLSRLRTDTQRLIALSMAGNTVAVATALLT